MQSGSMPHFFLGADSRYGYHSLYGSLLSGEACEIQYIIKGGHAFGKSVFLNELAKPVLSAGYDVECYMNTVKPEYIDGIYIPALKTAFVDGEIPHVVNALYPGAVETYVDLGAMYDTTELRRERGKVIELTAEIDAAKIRLTRYLGAAGEVRDNIVAAAKTANTLETIKRRARGIYAREFSKNVKGSGICSYRFLGIASESAALSDFSFITARCGHVCVIDNDFGLADEMLSVLLGSAVSAGHDVTVFLDPLEPDKTEHIFIPALSLAFISKKTRRTYNGEVYKHFRLDALPRAGLSNTDKLRVKSDRRLLSALLEKADETRADIKALSAGLDSIYTQNLNIDGIAAYAKVYAGELIQ